MTDTIQYAYKSNERIRLIKHKDVEGTHVGKWTDKETQVQFDFTPYPVVVRTEDIEPVPRFDAKDLRKGDLVVTKFWNTPFQILGPNGHMSDIQRVWRLDDESGDYRLIFPPREVQS